MIGFRPCLLLVISILFIVFLSIVEMLLSPSSAKELAVRKGRSVNLLRCAAQSNPDLVVVCLLFGSIIHLSQMCLLHSKLVWYQHGIHTPSSTHEVSEFSGSNHHYVECTPVCCRNGDYMPC